MKRLDLKKQYCALYSASARTAALVEVPELLFLVIDGQLEEGSTPGTSAAFQLAVETLYGAAYTLKFMSKLRKAKAIDYPVMPLEAIWWVEDGKFVLSKSDRWRWRAMILQPVHITAEMLAEAAAKLRTKKPALALDALRLMKEQEGLCVQMLHVGSYATEPVTVARMAALGAEQGIRERHELNHPDGQRLVHDHHEIYLSDPRRTAAVKLKTILRRPVIRAGTA